MTNSEARRQQLKKLSDERVSHWPNTLQATRAKKENWKMEKMAVEELSRQKIDREEAELQKRLRIESIRRANTILYEQTDKMKNLRSQQMYSDVLADRTEQVSDGGEGANATQVHPQPRASQTCRSRRSSPEAVGLGPSLRTET